MPTVFNYKFLLTIILASGFIILAFLYANLKSVTQHEIKKIKQQRDSLNNLLNQSYDRENELIELLKRDSVAIVKAKNKAATTERKLHRYENKLRQIQDTVFNGSDLDTFFIKRYPDRSTQTRDRYFDALEGRADRSRIAYEGLSGFDKYGEGLTYCAIENDQSIERKIHRRPEQINSGEEYPGGFTPRLGDRICKANTHSYADE